LKPQRIFVWNPFNHDGQFARLVKNLPSVITPS